jgi:hypothetical protein
VGFSLLLPPANAGVGRLLVEVAVCRPERKRGDVGSHACFADVSHVTAVPAGSRPVPEPQMTPTPVEEGAKLARFRISRYGREPKVGMEADLPVYIALGDPPVSLDGLYEINKHLADFLSLFEELL